MRTPSLRRRVTVSGVVVFALLVTLLDIFVYLTLRERLQDTLAEVLDTRVDLARELGEQLPADELVARLTALGVPVTATTAEGEVLTGEPATPRFGAGPPGPVTTMPTPRVSEPVRLEDGTTLEVYASSAGVEATLARTATLLLVGTVLALAIAAVLFRRAAAVVVAPLEEVAAAAGRTTQGHAGERLRPDDPDTELGQLATAYDTMLDALEEALGTARAAEERTRRFVDDAAHQMRTPIATLRSCVEALLKTAQPDIRDELFGYVIRETARCQRLLDDLLNAARFDQGHDLAFASHDLAAICLDEVERARSLAPALTLVMTAPSDAVEVRVDADAIRELLANLLDNARRHAATRIEVVVSDASDAVTVTVADDGPGLPTGSEERVFERFTSLDGRGGSGLGLPIARQIARTHGGGLAYSDGAFRLRLPRTNVTGDGAQR
ncbi:ATP-binding protein [Egicoccus sp. AB-alg6-2]|uniref:sensor histidine kinase n=1 Tax=Egicoccus sp. AB-alg6-2 TaxID=3242692 RepID=UPI00359D32D6